MEAPDQDRRHGEDHRFLLEGWPSLLRPLFIEEAEKSLHDAIMIVRRALKNSTVVADGGAIDMEVSQYLRQHAREIAGKSQLFINSYAKAIEVIPRQLCDNAEFDATDFLNKLRQKHASGANFGVDINTGGITDSFANFVWEPAVVKINAINAATEATCLILSVNETEKIPKIGMVTKYVCWGCEGWLDLQLVEKQLKMGDINRIPASSAFYMVNTGQRLHIICSIDTTSYYTMDWLAPPYQYSSLAVESLPNPCSPGST